MNNLISMVALTAQSYSAEQVEAFFTKDHLTELMNSFADWGISMLGKLILSYLVWKIGKKVIKVLVKLNGKALGKGSLDESVLRFISSILKVVLYAILLLMIIDILGFQTTSLLTIFGSAALAVGMSLQGSLSNFAGGILLLVFRPFTTGDYIISGSNEGTVTSIEMLYTKLLTIDNKVVMIPNGNLSNSSITNVGAEGVRRLDIEIGVGYSTDLGKAKKLLEEIVNAASGILQDKDKDVIVKRLDESSVVLETRAWVRQEDYWNTRFFLLEKYKNVFDSNGIEIPYNQMDVHIKQ